MNHRIIILSMIFLLMGIFSSCGQGKKVESKAYGMMLESLLDHSVPEITVDSAAEILSKDGEVILLDTRSQEEFEVSHIKGAKWVGYKDFDTSRVAGIPKDKKVILYCAVGKRSEQIAERLREAGFKDVANMYGGIFEWKNRENEVYQGDQPTDSVHAYSRVWGVWLKKGKKVY